MTGGTTLEVSDTGIGIPPALRERVFDSLFTTTGSKNDPLGSGMGLGLTLVRRGAEAFGGRVAVVRAGEGFATAVRIRLPLRSRGGEAMSAASRAILLIDDERDKLESLAARVRDKG